MRKPILFISTIAGNRFGGSEELWTRAAALLAKQGVPVAASVEGWPQLDQRIGGLSRVGVDLRPRPVKRSLISRVRRYMSGKDEITFDVGKSFGDISPSLVVMSNGWVFPPAELAEMCIARGWPFVTVAHNNSEGWWPTDELATRMRKILPSAQRCFFVSEANRAVAERQLGYDFTNAEIVRNPLTVEIDSPILWPPDGADITLRVACVGRLYPNAKGQDILLDILATPRWADRNWRLTLCGDGPDRDVLERLVRRLKLQDRVSFAGHVAVAKIWRENHILVMPSRHEGMPLTIVEAMFCGRPVVATNVGGNSELIKHGLTGFLATSATVESFGVALEQMWAQRGRLQEMGTLAAADIREFLPNDPVGIFANKLKDLARFKR